jgi:hypothetical protein
MVALHQLDGEVDIVQVVSEVAFEKTEDTVVAGVAIVDNE